MTNTTLDPETIRQELPSGPSFWRCLDELADQEGFLAAIQPELPPALSAGLFRTNRRQFLKLAGAMLAMAGLTSCGTQPPKETIVPYVNAPEAIIPGRPLYFATAMPFRGYTSGLLVENHEGRPTKIEGNPDHPASQGATDPYAQAAIFALYDPERPQVVSSRGNISTWEAFLTALDSQLTDLRASQGAGLYLLTETVTSPTLAAQLQALQAQFPQMQWHQYEPYPLDNARNGAQLAFGRVVNPVYHFDQAQVILSLDADFLREVPGALRYARDFSNARRVWQSGSMNRLYVVETTPTLAGAKADQRLSLRPAALLELAKALAQLLGLPVRGGAGLAESQQTWLAAVARDLQAQRGASLVLAGDGQPPAVHLLAHALNDALGNVGHTVSYTEPVEASPVVQLDSIRTLAEEMRAGRVKSLLIIESNPVYSAPADLDFADALNKVPFAVHTSVAYDETSALCGWHIPATHFLEAWSDGRAYDGTATILQPLIDPLFNSWSPHQLLSAYSGQPTHTAYEIVRATWEQHYNALAAPKLPDFETFWRTAVHDGVVPGSAFPATEVTLRPNWADAVSAASAAPPSGGLDLLFRPDPSVWDGRFANNPWLQELPKPLTTLTWDNALLISPAMASRLALVAEDEVEMSVQGRSLTAAIWVTPGQPDESATLYLGYGRSAGGQVGAGIGFNAYQLRTVDNFFVAPGLELRKTGRRYRLANTQEHDLLDGRDLVRSGSLTEYQQEPNFAQNEFDRVYGVGPDAISPPSMYPEVSYDGYAWGMAIDLGACVGCNACVIACQVENNIPTVGKEQVLNSREMQWLKIDRYYQGEADQPATFFQPRLCMHCERAPCEPVCPVAATVHDSEGLNQMVYNRCVGTRYCSNNCPYKVRRFNFYEYTEEIPLIAMARNPDVTVRSRGVMEKCTYCVQRINQARILAEEENRPIGDGEVITACQAACPTRAIIFGDINNSKSLVAQMKSQPLNYGMLAQLGTQPRTTYLAEVRNPNPELGDV